jgi:hypothetical protein
MTGTFNITMPFFGFRSRDLFICGQVLRYDAANGDRAEISILHRTGADGVARRLGFLTDFASKPWLAQLMVDDRCDEGTVAYAMHDWVYCTQKVSRLVDGRWIQIAVDQAYCDSLLLEMCLALGMAETKARMIYDGVRIGGASHFKAAPTIVADVTVENLTEDFAVLTARVVPDFDLEEAA